MPVIAVLGQSSSSRFQHTRSSHSALKKANKSGMMAHTFDPVILSEFEASLVGRVSQDSQGYTETPCYRWGVQTV